MRSLPSEFHTGLVQAPLTTFTNSASSINKLASATASHSLKAGINRVAMSSEFTTYFCWNICSNDGWL